MKHGDKLGENLYFCMYPITLSNYLELEKLARSAKAANYSFMRGFDLTAVGLGCPMKEAIEKLEAWNLENQENARKYEGSGADALIDIYETFERNVDVHYMDEASCFLACLSSQRPHDSFVFEKDGANIEMMVAVLSAPYLDYTIHLGIQRPILYALKNNPFHPNISMLLHGAAAQYTMENFPDKKFMVTNPLTSMQIIFMEKIPHDKIYTVKHYDLDTVRNELGISKKRDHLQTFNLDDSLNADSHFAVSLKTLSSFSKNPIEEQKKNTVGCWRRVSERISHWFYFFKKSTSVTKNAASLNAESSKTAAEVQNKKR